MSRTPTPSEPDGSDRPRRSLPRRMARWLLLLVLGLVLLGAAAFAFGYLTTDIPDPNEDFTAQTSFVYYSDGTQEIGRFASQNRTSVPLSEVPEHVQQAVIAAEDRTFYSNQGIDPKGILRAAFSNARGNSTQGASTITQQYVKVFYLSQERTLTRKVKEAFVSLKLQRQMSKAEILEGYLNTIYFGRGSYGIQAAAQAYFDKNAAELTVREGAALAAILNSPTNFDPDNGADARARLLGRYQYVLSGMASAGDLPTARAERLEARLPEFPRLRSTDTYGGQKGHLLTLVRKELLALGFTDEEISGDGLKVTTTFTRNAMDAAAAAVRDQRPTGLKGLHVAVASVDPATGALRGMFAGQDYLDSQINWAVSGSSPGSAFKPFALAAGLQDGYALDSTFQGNSPYVFANGSGEVVNEGPGDGNDYGSSITLDTATEQSVNTAYVDLTESMENGPEKILDMAVRMGVPRDAPGLQPFPGISLGSATISPIDMANSYGTIAAGGQAKKWFSIERVTEQDGTRRYTAPKKRTRALAEDLDRDVSYALQQVVSNGTGAAALALGRPAAGKTGTATNENGNVSSSWFVGYTPQLATAVMYARGDGNDNINCIEATSRTCTPGYLVPYFGASYPARTWTQAMDATLDDAPVQEFPEPAFVDGEREDEPAPSTPEPSPESEAPAPVPSPSPTRTPNRDPTPTPDPAPTQSPTTQPPSRTPTPTQPSPTPTPPDPDAGGDPEQPEGQASGAAP